MVLKREVVMSRPPLITKDTRVAELLRDYPETEAVLIVLDESQLDPDVMPINRLLRAAKDLADGEIVQLVTSHVPAPGIDVMRRKGYSTWATAHDQEIWTYFTRNPTSPDASDTSD
jgi:hypothetical protein